MSWKKVKLGEIYTAYNGLSKSKKFFGTGDPFLTFSTVFNNYFLPRKLTEYVQSTIQEQQKYSICRGDIFITRTSEKSDELGLSCVALKDYPKATYNGFTKRLRPINPDCVVPEYIGYYMRMPAFRQEFQAFSTMTTRASLRNDDLLGLTVLLPNIKTQERIAGILRHYDFLIENNQKQIKLLEEAAQRLYKEWFVDLRFPGHENVGIIDGVPEGWNINRADHYFKITIGKTPSRAEKQWFTNSGEGTPWISISDMGEAGVFTFYSKEDLTADAIIRHNMKIVPKGTILVSFKLTVGRVAITGIDVCTNEAIAHFHIDNDLDRAYTYCYLKNFEYDSLGNTSSISKAINSKIIKSIPFIMPSGDILEKFSMIVQPILNQIELKQKIIFRLTESRDRLLPKLMSGEIEV